ncbi:hypothetical protein DBT_0867 [Dissulfuribacter thermophilus]|uniref:Uncharacterized protein n=1 Tax=Dissulfuribacter thermophilus TaxID=1156395 RepID=A0A1B9F7P6_9BACT|nr:hypothetical protein [Dissulfuribacter thermophilus]OCC15942.1 hypothetical protein DBT_0867 [Dissulfuribacter thermophilus]
MQGAIAIARNWAETLRARKLSVAMVSGIGLGLFIGFGLFFLWVLGCIIGGLIEAGGPIGFVKSWFDAAFGI